MKKIVKPNILQIRTPDNALPVIFDSPHSGRSYPKDFNYTCSLSDLRRLEDPYVDDLFSDAPALNAHLLSALFPRSYIDVNRANDDIDDLLFEGTWPQETYGEINPSSRSNSGVGLIGRLIKPGNPIYSSKLTPEEIMNRVKNYYEPYHDTLCTTLNDAYYNHGQFWHINCHSMPSSSAYPRKNITLIGNKKEPSDIVLGDLDGKTCSREFIYELRQFWLNKGYRVTINDPFKGVELISRYSQPTRGKNSIQIEINRNLYINEDTYEKNNNFDAVKNDCTEMIRLCTHFAKSRLTNIAAD
ncbi:MAG: N-formylglutamate amidohydrolase [Alphaproteobacteria bacterium]